MTQRIVVNDLKAAVSKMTVAGITKVHFDAGRTQQILDRLIMLDESITQKNNKYPLIYTVMPFRIRQVNDYKVAFIDKISICALSTKADELVLRKFESESVFQKVLYPCYEEFLLKVAQSGMTTSLDPFNIQHDLIENPGLKPMGDRLNDFVDSLDILNIQIILNNITNNNCYGNRDS